MLEENLPEEKVKAARREKRRLSRRKMVVHGRKLAEIYRNAILKWQGKAGSNGSK
jgi:hypothetical protein